MKKHKQKGFTLIELLVVISIIGLISSAIFAVTKNAVILSRDARRIADLRQISNAIQLYGSDHNQIPKCADADYPGVCDYADFTTPGCNPCLIDTTQDGTFLGWLAPYVNSKILDPINQYDFYYYTSGEFPPNSGRFYKYILGTFLEKSNNQGLNSSLAPQAIYPGWYVLGESL